MAYYGPPSYYEHGPYGPPSYYEHQEMYPSYGPPPPPYPSYAPPPPTRPYPSLSWMGMEEYPAYPSYAPPPPPPSEVYPPHYPHCNTIPKPSWAVPYAPPRITLRTPPHPSTAIQLPKLTPLPPMPAFPLDSTSTPPKLVKLLNKKKSSSSSTLALRGFTENLSVTYISTGNPCLDFFFQVVPDTPSSSIEKLLEPAWTHNSLTTLKLICHLRDIRGTGKSDKEGFYTAALWLHKHHPKTLACNTRWLAEFGYLKDLPEILYRVLEGLDVRNKEKRERLAGMNAAIHWIKGKRIQKKETKSVLKRGKKRSIERGVKPSSKLIAQMNSKERTIAMAKKARDMYMGDTKYRFLHDNISDVFADLLKSDIKLLESGNKSKISFAAKWCPSLDSSYDRSTLLCESIARKVFPLDSDPEYEKIEEAHYAYRVRDRLRKQVLVPLRKTLELPELFMSSKEWNTLPYNRVSSVAMTNYASIFLEHDSSRFTEFLGKVEKGKAKIAAGALLPHEILDRVNEWNEEAKVGELQWQRMVDDMSKEGKFKNCLAVCDVSGSMSGTPMDVCIALGILLSELCEEPWKGKVITFSENPQLHTITGNSLAQKKSFVRNMEWMMNTNFQKVFDKILEIAVNGKLRKDQMLKRVFVFSDMEFDQACSNSWETDYEVIQRKFKESGYGKAVPEIVFWNLRHSNSVPVTKSEKGVALVGGYSKNIMKLFLKDEGIINPESVMEKAISGVEYENLMVYD